MNIVFSSNKNPHFLTITEYIENAFKAAGHQTLFFDDRSFVIPGRIRNRFYFLNRFDLRRINQKLLKFVQLSKPDLFLEAGGHRISPETIDRIKSYGVPTVLWTIDSPREFKPVIEAAVHYDYVFTGGSEAYDLLKEKGIAPLHWLPFACDPEVHKPLKISEEDKRDDGCDICFVGSYYPIRERLLSELADYRLGIWGPGWDRLSKNSPLKKCVKGLHTKPEEWLNIYGASKIVLAIHYQDPEENIPCHQASPRVYEALASGAFLVCDSQRDVMRLFQNGRDLLLFKDREDLVNVVSDYLHEPEAREAISRKGRETVLKKHTYRHRIEEMLRMINLR